MKDNNTNKNKMLSKDEMQKFFSNQIGCHIEEDSFPDWLLFFEALIELADKDSFGVEYNLRPLQFELMLHCKKGRQAIKDYAESELKESGIENNSPAEASHNNPPIPIDSKRSKKAKPVAQRKKAA